MAFRACVKGRIRRWTKKRCATSLLLHPRDYSSVGPHRPLENHLAFDRARQKGLGPKEIGNRAKILFKCGKRLEFVVQFNFWKKPIGSVLTV
jgi:hypothetical protein